MHPDGLHGAELTKKGMPEIYERLQNQAERLEHLIVELSATLGPVLIQGGPQTDTVPGPEEAPYHEYHSLVIRFEQLNTRLSEVLNLIKL